MKLKAFSMLEVLVAIVISGMVMGTAYSVYIFSYQQLGVFKKSNIQIRDYFELSHVLNCEFEQAKRVLQKSERDVEFELTNTSVHYLFEEQFILRTMNEEVDTFQFEVLDVGLSLLETHKEEQFIEQMELTLKRGQQEHQLSFRKEYGADLKMEE